MQLLKDYVLPCTQMGSFTFSSGDPMLGEITVYKNMSHPSIGDKITHVGTPPPRMFGFKQHANFVEPNYFKLVWYRNGFAIWQPIAPAGYVVRKSLSLLKKNKISFVR